MATCKVVLMVHFYAAIQVWLQHGSASPDVQLWQVLQSYWMFWFILGFSCSLERGRGCSQLVPEAAGEAVPGCGGVALVASLASDGLWR